MAASGAPQGDGEVGLALPAIERKEKAQQVLDLGQERAALLEGHHKLFHGGVAAVEALEAVHEVRVRQEANVENEVGVVGRPVLEAEGHEGDRQLAARSLGPVALDEELGERLHQVREVLPFPDVHPEGDQAHVAARMRGELRERRDESRRQVVHAEVAQVLEALDRETAASPRQPGDDHEAERRHDRGLGGAHRSHRFLGTSRRWWEGMIPSSSRYLATVRQAMFKPCPRSTWATSWSESGLPESSAATMSRIVFLMETDDTISPLSEAIPL